MAPYLGLRGKPLNYAISLTAGVAFMLQGYDQGVLGSLLGLESFVATFPEMDTVNTTGAAQNQNSLIQGTVVAVFELGALLGCWGCIAFGDKLGRTRTLLVGMVIEVIGAAIQASSFSVTQLGVSRVMQVTGCGVGIATATVPIWVAECSPAHDRGSMVVVEGFFAVMGGMLSTWVDFGFYLHTHGTVTWRFPIAFQIVFALMVMVMVSQLPESPRWLIKQNRVLEATERLSLLDDMPVDSEELTARVQNILFHAKNDQARSFRHIFQKSQKRYIHRMALALAIQCFNQLTGIDALSYYTAIIYQQSLHLSETKSKLVAGLLQTWQWLSAGVPFFVVDRFGRRPLILFGTIGMSICMAFLAGLVSVIDRNEGYQIGAVFFTFLFNFFFPIALLAVAFLYTVEIVPLEIRAQSTGVAVSGNWLMNFLVAEVTPTGFTTIGYRYYIVYACTNAAIALSIYLFFPETKGLSLEDVDDMFIQSPGVRAVTKHRFRPEEVQTNALTSIDSGKIENSTGHIEEIKDV